MHRFHRVPCPNPWPPRAQCECHAGQRIRASGAGAGRRGAAAGQRTRRGHRRCAAAAEAAYAADRYPDAQRLAEAVVAADPLREAMWRTLMRVRSAVGDYDGVVSTFAQSQRALRAAEIAPAAATRALLDQLRR
ncbi:MAG: BTAD domain-containing putative transcriptional regulator [Mycobacterium sp.]|uniref:BTAD domain-containing putative transcriptional regulator n=2 Tax=Mycobacterium sp. TaxID=1785 RepID=UPI003CAC1793